MSGFAFLVVLAVFGVVIASAIRAQRARTGAWAAFAASHGLRFHAAESGGTPRLSGAWGGVPVTLAVEYVGSGNHRKAYTRATARIQAALPRGLTVTAENLADKLVKLLGGQDVQAGLPEVDQKLRIKAEDQDGARQIFQNWRFRQAALAFALSGRDATLSQHQATVAQPGFLSQPAELTGLLDLVARCAREVEAAIAAPAPPGPAPGPTAPPTLRRAPAQEDPDRPRPHQGPTEAPPPRPVPAPALLSAPAAPAPAPSVPDAVSALDGLLRLGDRALGAPDRNALIEALRGHAFPLRLEVERVALSQGTDLPGVLADGLTVIGKPAGQPTPRLVVRFPPSANPQIVALAWGDRMGVTARLVRWDEFYRHAVLDADPDIP